MSINQTVRSHFIDYEISSECLQELNKLIKGESIEYNERNENLIVLVLLGHVELYERIPIDNENVVERILHKHHIQTSTENEIEYIIKHFSEVKNIERLPFEVIYHILSNLDSDECGFILEFIENYFQTTTFQESKIKHKKSKLLQCIKIQHLSKTYLKKYFSLLKELSLIDAYQVNSYIHSIILGEID